MKMSNILNAAGGFLKKNAPWILTGIGIGGNVASTIVAVKNTPKALAKIEARKEELGVEKLGVGETIRTTWKDYAPSLILTTASSACLIGSVNVGAKRTAAMAAAYEMAEIAYKEYRDDIHNILGEEKANEVDCEAANRANSRRIEESIVVVAAEERSDCYFEGSGVPFKASINEIKEVINKLNHRMITGESYISFSDLLDEFDIPHTSRSDYEGWNLYKGGFIEIRKPEADMVNNKPMIKIPFESGPYADFTGSW